MLMHTPEEFRVPGDPALAPCLPCASRGMTEALKRVFPGGHLYTPHGSLRHERHLPGADGQEFIATSLALSFAL